MDLRIFRDLCRGCGKILREFLWFFKVGIFKYFWKILA